ncbi:MAG: FAD/NAD(P)-binding oxidoreductase [Thermoproteota archaeon]|nr:MAG: FAD/NAD(P)-binding oxidoreductase [Candidatus Korarchaeota archaeon]
MGLEGKVRRVLKGYPNVSFHVRDGVVFLKGRVGTHREWVELGLSIGCLRGVEGVVNDVEWEGMPRDRWERLQACRDTYMRMKDKPIGSFDVVIVGGGVIGAMVARELSRYKVRVALVEEGPDVSLGASKANNGMIHPGVAPKHGTLKRGLNVRGNKMYDKICRELSVRFSRPGSLWLITPRTLKSRRKYLKGPLYTFTLKYIIPLLIKIKGLLNGVKGIRIIRGREIFKLEPMATKDALAAVFVPSTGILDPYELTIALVENAVQNGVELFLNTKVVGFTKEGGRITGVVTSRGRLDCRFVVNAAGVYADEVAELAGTREYTIHPRKGILVLFDRRLKDMVRHCLAEVLIPTPPRTKGGGINPTVHGNIMWGPSAIEVPSKEDVSAKPEEVREVLEKYSPITPEFPKKIIRYFAGVRAATFTEDFIIRPAKWVKGFIHVAGIQSPGLASAPAIAEYVVEILRDEGLELKPKEDFNPYRKLIPSAREMSLEELDRRIREDPRWGRIVCVCEMVSEAEVVEAVRRGARSIDAVKRRTRAGMGECQGDFCLIKVAEILSRELGVPLERVLKEEEGSELFNGHVRGEEE